MSWITPTKARIRPHEQADQRNDGQGLHAAFLNGEPDIGRCAGGTAPEQPSGAEDKLADEIENIAGHVGDGQRKAADPFEEARLLGLTLRGGVRGNREGQLGQVADAFGEAGVIKRDVALSGEGDEPGGDHEHAAVPFAEILAEEFDAAGLLQEPFRLTQRFVALLKKVRPKQLPFPFAAENDAQDALRALGA